MENSANKEGNGVFSAYISNQLKSAYGKNFEKSSSFKRMYHIKNILPLIDSLPDEAILEVGPGFGEMLALLKETGRKNIAAVDVSGEVVEFVKKNMPEIAMSQIHDISEFLEAHPASFKQIILLDVLEHIPKDKLISTISAIKRALSPNGNVIIQVINGASPFIGNCFFSDFTHECLFTENSLSQLLKMSGFEKIKLSEYKFPGGVLGLVRTVLRWSLHFFYRVGVRINGTVPIKILTPNLIVQAWK